jgi:hypothetical protein
MFGYLFMRMNVNREMLVQWEDTAKSKILLRANAKGEMKLRFRFDAILDKRGGAMRAKRSKGRVKL